MNTEYKRNISNLIDKVPFDTNTDIEIKVNKPSSASSNFLTNKEQGDWAEQIVYNAINEYSQDYCAIKYGHMGTIHAGDPGFDEYFEKYVSELDIIGKKPDILIFRRNDIPKDYVLTDDLVRRAVAAIEVRSSSFLANKYSSFMKQRIMESESAILDIQNKIFSEPYSNLLLQKNPELYKLLRSADVDSFRTLNFNLRRWSSTPLLQELSDYLKIMKQHIKVLHKRDYLSITPKLEDLVLVNRWIQNFGVRHCYLQVFFDKAYVIPFHKILELTCDPSKEGEVFSIERDVKNQGKTTIKVNIHVGREILKKIDMPDHQSVLKELARGRLLFYVTFHGGRGYLDLTVFSQEIVNEF